MIKVKKEHLGGIAFGLLLALAWSGVAGAVDLNTGLQGVEKTTETISRNAIIGVVVGAILALIAAFAFGGWKGYSKAKKEQDVDNPVTAAAIEGIKYAGIAFVAEFLIAYGIEQITNVNLFEKVVKVLFP